MRTTCCRYGLTATIGASRMFSVLTERCYVGYYGEFIGTVYCTYGPSISTIESTCCSETWWACMWQQCMSPDLLQYFTNPNTADLIKSKSAYVVPYIFEKAFRYICWCFADHLMTFAFQVACSFDPAMKIGYITKLSRDLREKHSQPKSWEEWRKNIPVFGIERHQLGMVAQWGRQWIWS